MTELIKESLVVLPKSTKLLDTFANFLGSFIRVLSIELFLVVIEKSLLLKERVVDEIVVEELGEYAELLNEELVNGIDGSTKDTNTMSLD